MLKLRRHTVRSMHGYHPDEKHSFASLCTNRSDIPDEIVAIPDVYKLMTSDAMLAKQQNSAGKRVGSG